MKELAGKIIKYSLSAAAAVLLLWFSFKGVEWKDFISILKECRWGWVLLSMLAGYAGIVVRSLRWRMLIAPIDPSIGRLRCYDGVNVGRLSDFVVPHAGELVRCVVVSGKSLSYDRVLGTVVVERSWDILSLLLLIVIFLLSAGSRYRAFFSEHILSPLSDSLSFSFWWLFLLLIALTVALVIFIWKTRTRFGLCGKICAFFKGLGQGAAAFLKMDRKALFLLLTILLWGLFMLTSLFIIRALPQSYGLGLQDALFLMLVGSLAGVVPVPGGFGAFHYLIALALSVLFGIPWATGIVFATLCHESQAVMTAIAGLVSYAHYTLGRKK